MFILLHFNNNLITIFIYDLQELLNPLKIESLLGKRNVSGFQDLETIDLPVTEDN